MAESTKFANLQDLKLRAATSSDEPSIAKKRHEAFKEFMTLLRQNFVNQKNVQKSKSTSSTKNGQQLD